MACRNMRVSCATYPKGTDMTCNVSKKALSHIDPVLGRYKSDQFRKILQAWGISTDKMTVLKTDLREEAYGEDELLFSLNGKGSQFYAIDICLSTVVQADLIRKERSKKDQAYINGDVRHLPFKDNTFDLILSTSTLDHFKRSDELTRALKELRRVLKPDGTILLAMNNKCNFNFCFWLTIESWLVKGTGPVQFYTPHELDRHLKSAGLMAKEYAVVVHIINPSNSILKLLRGSLSTDLLMKTAIFFTRFADFLDRNKNTRSFTGWFITARCTKV